MLESTPMSKPIVMAGRKLKAAEVQIAPAAGGPSAEGFTGYTAAVKYLNERVNFERTRPTRADRGEFKLERMRAMLAEMGDPHRAVKFVHVTGSKGKGSVCEMVASCLRACGYTTGLYTSPHLVDVRERIRIGEDMISYAAFTAQMERVAAAAAKVEPEHGEATFFEVITALALGHFAAEAVDIAVIEVGLGGRLDATNVIMPEVAAITAIQAEHTEVLGDTLEEIAREKAGILKPGVVGLTIPQSSPSVVDAMRAVAAEVGATLRVVGQDIEFTSRFEAAPDLGPHARVCVTTPRSNYEHLPVPLKGEHQAANCGLALAILDALRDRGFEAPERMVAEGLAATPSHGRMEIVWDAPRVLVDGAHNPESVHCLVKSIGAHIRYDSMVVIFGCASDKDVAGMLSKIALGADKIIFTRSANPRAVDPRELQRRFADVSGKMTQIAKSLPEAIDIARRAVGRDDLVCITGSFYLAGEGKKYFMDLRSKKTEAKATGR
jgi:dihydrofolate synthase / folylpolyglutamate synthase